MEAGMVCTIDGEMFYLFTKNMQMGNLGASCDITNNDTGLFDVNEINESVQESSGDTFATKEGKL